MGLTQGSPGASARLRAYSGSAVHTSTAAGSVTRYYNDNQQRVRLNGRDGAIPIISQGSGTPRDADRGQSGPRLLVGSLPAHLSSHLLGATFHCPVCSKSVASDEIDLHLVMCLTKPSLTYNDDILMKDSGECAICLDDMAKGDTIARLPCLCIYHKRCIDDWFEVNRSCPEHPTD